MKLLGLKIERKSASTNMNDLEFVEEGDTLFHVAQPKLQHQEQDEEVKGSPSH